MAIISQEPALLHGVSQPVIFEADFSASPNTYTTVNVIVTNVTTGQLVGLYIPLGNDRAKLDVGPILRRWVAWPTSELVIAYLDGNGTADPIPDAFVRYTVSFRPYYLDGNGLLALDSGEIVTSFEKWGLLSAAADLTDHVVAPGVTPYPLLTPNAAGNVVRHLHPDAGGAFLAWSSGDTDAARFTFEAHNGTTTTADVYVHNSTAFEAIIIGVGRPNIEGGTWTLTPKSIAAGESMPGPGEMGSIRAVTVELGRYDAGAIGEFVPTHQPARFEYVRNDWGALWLINAVGGLEAAPLCTAGEVAWVREANGSFSMNEAAAIIAPAITMQQVTKATIHANAMAPEQVARNTFGWWAAPPDPVKAVAIELERAFDYFQAAAFAPVTIRKQPQQANA